MNLFQPLINPFVKHDSKTLLILGISTLFIGSAMAYGFHARYDGAFDLHFSKQIALWSSLTDNVIAILSVVIVFFAAGKMINRKTRFIDILTVVLISRLPLYLVTPINIYDFTIHTTEQVLPIIIKESPMMQLHLSKILGLIAISAVTLLFIIWMFILLYQGFKVATNGKGAKITGTFIIALIVAEVFSQIIFSFIL